MKSLESAAFIGGFISAHYVELYIKPWWKPRGSPTVKRRFQMRKTPTSNSSSLSLSSSPPLPPSLPLSSSLSQDLSPFFFFSRLGHSVLFFGKKPINSVLEKWIPRSAVMERAKLCFYFTKTFWERRAESISAELLRSFFLSFFRNNFKPAGKQCSALY